MTAGRTPFDQACRERGWTRPAVFLAEFARTARLIGEQVTVTDRQFRRWRAPNPPRPHPRSCRVLHAMFGVPPTELGFPPAPNGETTPYAPLAVNSGAEETDVKRRTFVTATMGTAAAVTIPGATIGAIGTAHLQDLQAGLTALDTLDSAHGSDTVLPLAIQHLTRIRHVIEAGTYPTSIGQRLHLLAGEAAAQCGFLAFDAGRQEQARSFFGEALATAAMLKDEDLTVQVLAQLGLQAMYEQRPRAAYDFLQAARCRAEAMGSARLQSLIAVREARALAMLGDHALAQGDLARGMRLLERSGRGRPAPDWVSFYGPAEINLTQGHLYSAAGRHSAASSYYRASVNQLPVGLVRNRVNYRLRLAHNLTLAGEADEAAAEALAVLDELPAVSSARTRRHLTDLHRALATIDSPTTRDAAEALAARLV
jgi:hypothetical protein